MEKKKLFELLGISEAATQAEVDAAYKIKVSSLKDGMIKEGDAGAKAAEMLTLLHRMYEEYKSVLPIGGTGNSHFQAIDNALKNNQTEKAQFLLDNISVRCGNWHYFQAIVFYKKNNLSACYNQLTMALRFDGSNEKFLDAMNKLKLLINN